MANDNVEEVGVRLVVDGQEVWASKFQKATQDVEGLGAAAQKHQTSVNGLGTELDKSAAKARSLGTTAKSAFREMGASVSDFVNPLRTVGSTLNSVGNQVRNFSYNFISPISRVTTVLGGATAAATLFGLKTYNSLEQANAAFTTLLGSQQAGAQFTQQLRQMANVTPFTFQNIMPAAEMMLNSGDNPTKALKDITAIGNAASAADPQDINGAVSHIALAIEQIRQEPVLTGDNIRQLEAANLNPYGLLSQAAGKNVNSSNINQIQGKQAADVLLSGLQSKYSGAMDRQQKTLSGQLSTLQDVVGTKMANATAPLALMLERDMPTITSDLGIVADKFGHVVNVVLTDGQILGRAFKQGGMHGMLEELGQLTGTGGTFAGIWKHVSTDSLALANIWEHSLYPSIKDVSSILGPFALGPLGIVEDIFKWMSEHPDVARVIFDGIGISFGIYKTSLLLSGMVSSFRTLIGLLPVLASGFYTSGAAAQVAATDYAEASVASALPLGSSASKAGTVAKDGEAAAEAGGLAASFGKAAKFIPWVAAAVGGLQVGEYLGKRYLSGGSQSSSSTNGKAPGQAAGGQTTASGWSWVGENGPEMRWMPKGATVVPLDKADGIGGRYQQVVFGEGAIQINGVDMDSKQLVATLIDGIQTKLARQ